MAHQEVDHLGADADRNVPVALRREPEHLELLARVPVGRLRGRRIVGQERARHVLPEEPLARADVVVRDWKPRVHRHAELPREGPEPEGVVRTADRAVVVEVEARGDASVGRRNERVAVVNRACAVLRDRQKVLLEQPGGETAFDVVELVDQQHVGSRTPDDLGDGARLSVFGRRQVANPGDRTPCCRPGAAARSRSPPGPARGCERGGTSRRPGTHPWRRAPAASVSRRSSVRRPRRLWRTRSPSAASCPAAARLESGTRHRAVEHTLVECIS